MNVSLSSIAEKGRKETNTNTERNNNDLQVKREGREGR